MTTKHEAEVPKEAAGDETTQAPAAGEEPAAATPGVAQTGTLEPAGDEAEGAASDAGEQAGDELDALKAQLAEETAAKEAALRERDELYDRWLRLQAEFDNFRKRTRRELEESKAKGAEELILKLLPVVDNLERALASAPGASAAAVAEGVKMIHKQFLSVLEDVGVRPIPAVGTPFDPTLHEAVAYEESDAHPDGVVMEEVLRGYAFGGRALRPSMVKVARGGGQQGGEA